LTEKELKKLNRYQLLELLILQTERADKLQLRLEELENQLNERNLQITSMGSIAEASLQLSGAFQSAQEAADMYVDSAKRKAEEILEDARKKAVDILAEAITEACSKQGETNV
jgi:cell division septum initiation protein DivIVA